jgi:hypothetical protein
MRYFTPELFEQLNSRNEALVLETLRRWDVAEDKYRAERRTWLGRASSGVQELAVEFCGHDGTVAASGRLGESFYYLYFVSELHEESVICYQLLTEPLLTRYQSSDACWEGDPLWMYDEVSRVFTGRYRHEILFGDGRILQIEFSDVAIRSWPAPKSKNGARPRVELTMPDPAAAVTSLSAAMKLWKLRRPPVSRKRKSPAKRRSVASVSRHA